MRLHCDIDQAVAEVVDMLSLKFDAAINAFANVGGPDDRTCMEIIEQLSGSRDGYLSLQDTDTLPAEVRRKAKALLTPGTLTKLAEDCPEWHLHFYYDARSNVLVIDDPQLSFYLRQISIPLLIRSTGKMARRQVFICFANADAIHLERLRVHLGPLSQRVGLELWDETRIEPGRRWRNELVQAIDASFAAILLVSADFLASESIQKEELPRILATSEAGKLRVIPVLIGPCLLEGTPIEDLQFINHRAQPISTLGKARQDVIWSGVASTIAALLT